MIALSDYLAMGWFGGGWADDAGRLSFERIPLLLSAGRREDAAAAGAVWSEGPRGWFAGPGSRLEDLVDWLPDVIAPHYYVAQSVERCWQCDGVTPVYALAVPAGHLAWYDLPEASEGPEAALAWEVAEAGSFVSDLTATAGSVRQVIAAHCPGYHVDYSNTAGGHFAMNHCKHCEAKIGEFYLHKEPGGPFFPMSPEDAARITLRPVRAPLLVKGCASISSEDFFSDCRRGDPIEPGAADATGQ
ncbi:hypothetical protein [Cupriavidus pampae]|uniref:Uncharacterized protein n=1 Tax=Cupriavidus pampae TaxID=659251 RepID=A0ABN7ZDU6_9BURK|nr:hypothetical protein [Cupriavidus pampae]CAG9183829.1 hypothetical protein LMG32289_05434 [Cupriavidus pampae]